MVKIENLSVAFGGSEVVKNVSFTIKDGEMLGVVGESGSGKSVTALTLMGLVSRNAEITSGRILFDSVTLREAGKPLDEALYRSYQGNEISMIFQEPMTSLNPVFTVGAQIAESLILHRGMDEKEALKEAVHLLELVRIPDAERISLRFPHQLSGGMRQRVAIARALGIDAPTMLLDEPFGALDPLIRGKLQELLLRLWNEGEGCCKTAVFVTHDIDEALILADRIVFMEPRHITREFVLPKDRARSADAIVEDARVRDVKREVMKLFDATATGKEDR